MKPTKFQILFSFMMFGLFAGFISEAVYLAFGLPTVVTGVALVAFMLMRGLRKVITGQPLYGSGNMYPKMSGVEVEIWANYIAENIYKNNQFLNHAFNADEYVLQGKVVHIPQSGAASDVVKNRSSLPATVAKRTDTDVTYAIDEYTTDPRLIPNADTVELSYDKMDSVMRDDMNALSETVAENMLIAWAPSAAAKIERTTGGGGDNPTIVAAHTTGATGNRVAYHEKDLLKMMTKANADNIPQDGRFAMFDAQGYEQVISSLTANQHAEYAKHYNAETGVLGRLHSWNIMMRSTALVYDNEATPVVKAYAAEAAITDNSAALFWHKDAVERAKGEIVAFHDDKNPQFYGDLMSFLMRMGGRKRRNDGKGVYALVQQAA